MELPLVGARLHARGWVSGTSGNMSVVIGREPLTLLTTGSGVHKGFLSEQDFVRVAADGSKVAGEHLPSAETAIHLAIFRATDAVAVLHTHSVWGTVLSGLCEAEGEILIHGYEMLKGLHGVTSHQHTERLPILANDQDMVVLGSRVSETLLADTALHCVLLARHGLYTWGRTLAECERHLEVLEFLLEAVGRTRSMS